MFLNASNLEKKQINNKYILFLNIILFYSKYLFALHIFSIRQ